MSSDEDSAVVLSGQGRDDFDDILFGGYPLARHHMIFESLDLETRDFFVLGFEEVGGLVQSLVARVAIREFNEFGDGRLDPVWINFSEEFLIGI
jgi:hypothetical protein